MESHWRQISWSIPTIAAALLACGWLAIARSAEIADIPAGALEHQMIWSAAALGAMAVVALADYRWAMRVAPGAFVVMLALLLAVYFFAPVNGAHRWIRVAGFGFQPAEFAKLALALMLARHLMYRDTSAGFRSLLAPLALTLAPLWLILKEPDLGTSLVFVPVLLAMLYAAGARLRHLAILMVVGVAALPALWSQMSRDQRLRVTALWEQGEHSHQATSPAAYHLREAKKMFALGGFGGSFFTAETADADDALVDRRVPEPHTDSVFCVLGERYGLVGCAVVLSLYVLLIWRGLAVAERTDEPFGRLLVVGVMAMISFQAVINTGMLVGLLPITGLPLPLVSYGGSGLIAGAIGLGLVMSVASRPGYEMR